MNRPIITLLTDFGHRDAYVGIMKGVIAQRCPEAIVIDLCHEVSPQAVNEAGYLLETSFPYFPRGAVHTAVVDPGVGSDRDIVCVCAQGHKFLAPDNGLLSAVVAESDVERIVRVTNAEYFLPSPSRTFHGRDIFAPVAAALAQGADPDVLGPRTDSIVLLPSREPTQTADDELQGEVVHVDRFGNLITNIKESALKRFCPDADACDVFVGTVALRGVCAAYSDVAAGEWLALIGSTGRLEISINQGSAAGASRCGVGARVLIHRDNA